MKRTISKILAGKSIRQVVIESGPLTFYNLINKKSGPYTDEDIDKVITLLVDMSQKEIQDNTEYYVEFDQTPSEESSEWTGEYELQVKIPDDLPQSEVDEIIKGFKASTDSYFRHVHDYDRGEHEYPESVAYRISPKWFLKYQNGILTILVEEAKVDPE